MNLTEQVKCIAWATVRYGASGLVAMCAGLPCTPLNKSGPQTNRTWEKISLAVNGYISTSLINKLSYAAKMLMY